MDDAGPSNESVCECEGACAEHCSSCLDESASANICQANRSANSNRGNPQRDLYDSTLANSMNPVPRKSCDSTAPVNHTLGNLAISFRDALDAGSGTSKDDIPQNDRRDDPLPFNAPIPAALNHNYVSLQRDISNPIITNSANQSHANQVLFNWQASKSNVKDRLGAVFNREMLADIHFVVGKEPASVKVPAHKFVLSIGSAVFDAMFNGQMAAEEQDIELPDIEPAAFLALLRFLYTDEVQIGPETVMTTLYTAKKYVVPALEKKCVEFLKQNLGSDNAFMLLTQARLFDESVLAQMCLDKIDKHTVDALAAEGFLDIDHDTLCMVLERDTLRIREVVLFNAVVRWAEAECIRQNMPNNPDNQRSHLKRALTLIRFPLMSVEEFASEVAQSGILTDREVVNLFLYFTVNPKPSVQFPAAPRCSVIGKEQVVLRFARTESRWGYSGTSDRIRFVVDRRIFVLGFGLYGSIHGPSDYDCNIQILHTGSGKVMATNDTSFSCDGTPHTFRVTFKTPVEILPNTNYTACATLKGSDSHYGTGGNRKVVVDLHGGGKVTFQFSYAAGCNNGTSVEDGQIPEILFYT